MAMKKKIAAGIGAVLVTAMCFGGSVFAESVPVNGSGATGTSSEGTTNATVTYTQGDDSTPTWSVNIPQNVDFGTINAATTPVPQILEYTANIANDSAKSISALKVSLNSNTASFDMKDNGHNPAVTASNAFTIKNQAGGDLANDWVIAELSSGETGRVQAVLNLKAFTDITNLAEGNHAFTGTFGIKVEPVPTTTP